MWRRSARTPRGSLTSPLIETFHRIGNLPKKIRMRKLARFLLLRQAARILLKQPVKTPLLPLDIEVAT
jgi:hypothetical protein